MENIWEYEGLVKESINLANEIDHKKQNGQDTTRLEEVLKGVTERLEESKLHIPDWYWEV